MKRIYFYLSIIALILSVSTSLVSAQSTNTWPMAGANAERTSWTPEEVRGGLSVEWYRPIEPYIPYKIQPIGANGKIYVSTSKGLYAFNATTGAIDWVYATELPLGHSPTIATVNNISTAYVGGFDRKIHAVNATTGAAISGYTPYDAGAGFETNPLVINDSFTGNQPLILAGNRDGYFYALNAVNGSLKWRFKTDAPISFSAAYKNGTVYFASSDNYAYALSIANGQQVWKSGKFPGQGFHSYWPVVYTDKNTNKDYVVFSTGENLRHSEMSLTDFETALFTGTTMGGSYGTDAGPWPSGTKTVNASQITNYYEDKPYMRTVFFLDSSNGVEYTFDSDGDGKKEYAPFAWSGITHGGTRFPGVVNGLSGIYYQSTPYEALDQWVSRGGPVGWKFGTPIVSVHKDGGNASDEPLAFAGGGKLLYWNLCCDREAGAYDLTIPMWSSGQGWGYFGYNLQSLIPGYAQMYDDGNTELQNDINGWQIFAGKNKSINGIYGKHGITQSPPIPYNGKVYMLKGNSLIAWSSNGSRTALPMATIQTVSRPATPKTTGEVTTELENEVQKMIAAGPLRPGYLAHGFYDLYGLGDFMDEMEYGEIFDYFKNPSDTVVTMIQALPYLSPASQTSVKNYLQQYYGPGKQYDITKYVHVGWGTGASRDNFEIPAEAYYPLNPKGIGEQYSPPMNPSSASRCSPCGYGGQFTPINFYAAWKYAQTFGNAKSIFDSMSSKIVGFPSTTSTTSYLAVHTGILNQYIAGYYGYLELQKLAGYSESSNVRNWYNQAMTARTSLFTINNPIIGTHGNAQSTGYYIRALSVARNFMFLTPELAESMATSLKTQVQNAVNEYNYVAPYWFVSQFDNTVGEGTFSILYNSPALFQAKAYILKEPYSSLVQYLDAPAFMRGDLFYIQNLVAALTAAKNQGVPTTTPGPTTVITPTPTSPPVTPGPGNTIEAENFVSKTGQVTATADTNASGGYRIGSALPGDTTQYSFTLNSAGTYSISVTTSSGAAASESRSLTVLIDNSLVGTIIPPITGAWNSFQTTNVGSKDLSAGSHTLTLRFDTGWFDVDKMTISGGTSSCSLKSFGDADCNGIVNISDFEIFRKEFTGSLATKSADFNADNAVNIIDFEILRKKLMNG